MDGFTAIIDSREQTPLTLEVKPGVVLRSQTGTLSTGDYSVLGLEHHVAIERKSLPDLMGCIGSGRERFEREIQRLLGYPVRALVVEAEWADIEMGRYRSRVSTSAAIGTLMGWIAAGIPVTMVGDHKRAGVFVARMLAITVKRRLKELKTLQKGA